MIIHKITKQPIGEIKITFSLKTKLFSVEYPNSDKWHKKDRSFPTYQECLNNIEKVWKESLIEEFLLKKVILIHLKTSVSKDIESTDKNLQSPGFHWDKNNHMSDAQGFQLEWAVANVYQYPNCLKYEILEMNKNNSRNHKRIDIRGQVFYMWSGTIREIDYREDLYRFLLSLDIMIEDMVTKLDKYFDPDPEKFLQNFSNTCLSLKA